MEDILGKAIEVVREGGIIIYPTDTAFGIGCRIDNRKAVDRLFSLRKRPLTQATPVLVSTMEMALKYTDNPSAQTLDFINRYWPGALTIITKTDPEKVYEPIRGGGGSIGLRMPNHEIPLTIIREVGIPILGPSANFHGKNTPFTYEDLDPELVKLVDLVVPGVCTLKQASTVVDCTKEPYTIVRQGAIILTI